MIRIYGMSLIKREKMNKQYKTIFVNDINKLADELNNIPKNYELVIILPPTTVYGFTIVIKEM